MIGGGAALLGGKEFDRKLVRLGRRGSKRAITAGIRAGMTPIAKAMRAAINEAEASAELKREARKTIGKRFARAYKSTLREAKVGFSVGKKQKTLKKTGGGASRGVGASARNIHWFVLGTDDRFLKTGHSTGQIENVFGAVTRAAVATSAVASVNAARRKIFEVIKREAQKRG